MPSADGIVPTREFDPKFNPTKDFNAYRLEGMVPENLFDSSPRNFRPTPQSPIAVGIGPVIELKRTSKDVKL